MIYLKKSDGTIEQHNDDMMSAFQIDKELYKQQNKDFGEIYTADSLPDEDKLKLGLITQKDIDNKNKEIRKNQIKSELANIDTQTIRPLRAKLSGTDSYKDTEKLKELETQAETLRAELKSLES